MDEDRGTRQPAADRGQTLQDFILGISIFVLGFVLVLSLIPGLLTPFESAVGTDEQATADRVSSAIVSNLSMPAQPNYLNQTAKKTLFDLSTADLENRFGIRSTTQLNVTLATLNGSIQINATGEPATRDEIAESIRIVSTDDPDCEPACRLIVRTW